MFTPPCNPSLVSACCVPGNGPVPATRSGKEGLPLPFASLPLARCLAHSRDTHLQLMRAKRERGWMG